MSRQGFGQLLMTWMYLCLCGATIVLAHAGAHQRFWILLLSAAATWYSLHRLARRDSAA